MEKCSMSKEYKFILLGFNLCICFFVMGTFICYEHFSIDDYSIYFYGGSDALHDISSNLRPVNGSLYYLVNAMGINVVKSQKFIGIALIILLAWMITIISVEIIDIMQIGNDLKKIIFVNSGALLFLLNASLCEFLYFSAAYIQWVISMAGAVLAAIYIGKEKCLIKNGILGLLALIVTAGSYQPFLAHYVYIVMILIFLRNYGELNRKSIWFILRAAMAAIIALALNLLIVRLLIHLEIVEDNSRMKFQFDKIPELVKQILLAQKSIWVDGLGVYPKYVLLVCLLFVLGSICFCIFQKKANFIEYIFAAIVLVSGQCVMWAAMIMQGHISILLRMLSPVFAIYAIGVWMIFYYIKNQGWKFVENICLILVFGFISFTSIKIGEVAIDIKITNAVSQSFAQEISNRISEYEKESGINITKVGFCTDKYISYKFYEYIHTEAYADICRNPFTVSWSSVTSLNYYSGRQFMPVEVPENIINYYQDQNWDAADWDEQLYFDQDTVYICAF